MHELPNATQISPPSSSSTMSGSKLQQMLQDLTRYVIEVFVWLAYLAAFSRYVRALCQEIECGSKKNKKILDKIHNLGSKYLGVRYSDSRVASIKCSTVFGSFLPLSRVDN